MAVYEGRAGNARILRRTASAVRLELFKDGDAKAADSTPAVIVVRADGTTVSTGAVTSPSTGVYESTLSTTETAQVDLLTATWSATVDASAMTFVTEHEVIGGWLFTETELRNFGDRAIADAVAFPDAKIAEARDRILEQFENACGVSFVTRYAREMLDGTGEVNLWASHRRITAVRSVSVDGAVVATSEIKAYSRRLWREAGWPAGHQNVVIAYEHGHARVLAEIRRQALLVARIELVPSDLGDRVMSYSNELGTFRVSIPGPGRPTGIPPVDEVLRRRDERALIA